MRWVGPSNGMRTVVSTRELRTVLWFFRVYIPSGGSQLCGRAMEGSRFLTKVVHIAEIPLRCGLLS
jgi:hypothetical protein